MALWQVSWVLILLIINGQSHKLSEKKKKAELHRELPNVVDTETDEHSLIRNSPNNNHYTWNNPNLEVEKFTESESSLGTREEILTTEDNSSVSEALDEQNKTIDEVSTVPTTTRKCRACVEIDEAKAFAIESIKARILKKLQLTALPHVPDAPLPKIPHLQRIIDKYNLQSDMPYLEDQLKGKSWEDPDDLGRTEKVFSLGTNLPEHLSYVNRSNACYFVIDVGENIIKRGKLWVYLRPAKVVQKTVTYLRVYTLGLPLKQGMATHRTLVKEKKILLERAGGWHHLDIVNVIDDWVDKPLSNYGLQVEALDHNQENMVVIPPGIGPDAGYEPFLAIRVIPNYHQRSKREAQKECNKEFKYCCKRHLLVDFQAFGWHFVVSPKRFVSYFCNGECPLLYGQESPRAHLLKNVNASFEACCKPSAQGPLQMLYRKNASTFVVEYIPGMITKSCSCS